MVEMPPQIVRQDVERIGTTGDRRPTDNLPVLNAFQRFLDAEREKTRKKMARFTAILALAVLVLLVVGAFGMFAVWLNARQSMKEWEERNSVALRRAEERSIQIEAAVGKAIEETRKWALSLDDNKREREERSEQRLSGEMEKVKAALAEMAKLNEEFRSEIETLRSQLPDLSNKVERISGKAKAESVAPVSESAAEEGLLEVAIKDRRRTFVRFGSTDLIIPLTPTNGTRTVAWCLPIPE